MLCCLLAELLVVFWVCRVGHAVSFCFLGWVLLKSVVLLGGALELFFSNVSGLWCFWSLVFFGLWIYIVLQGCCSLELDGLQNLLVYGTGLLSYAL